MEWLYMAFGLVSGAALLYAGYTLGWAARDKARPESEDTIRWREEPLADPIDIPAFGRYVPPEEK